MHPTTLDEGTSYDVPGHGDALTFRRIDWSGHGDGWRAVFELDTGLHVQISDAQLDGRNVRPLDD